MADQVVLICIDFLHDLSPKFAFALACEIRNTLERLLQFSYTDKAIPVGVECLKGHL